MSEYAARLYADALDLIGPYQEPCGLCGFNDGARHRVAEAITGRIVAGEDEAVVGVDYGLSEPAVLRVAVAVLADEVERRRRRVPVGRWRA